MLTLIQCYRNRYLILLEGDCHRLLLALHDGYLHLIIDLRRCQWRELDLVADLRLTKRYLLVALAGKVHCLLTLLLRQELLLFLESLLLQVPLLALGGAVLLLDRVRSGLDLRQLLLA